MWQARLTARKVLEEERKQWQHERDALLQKLTAQHTAAELQVRWCDAGWCKQLDQRWQAALGAAQ
jgi:hypothetical protein